MTEYVRTTIKLREDIYQILKKEAGAKNISQKINEILIKMLFKEKKAFSGQCRRLIYPISETMRTDYNASGFICMDGIFHGNSER